MKYVWPAWAAIRRRILAKKIKLLVLDFDGTLSAIAKTPQEAVLEGKTKEILARLGRSPSYVVAIVSGRSLKNLGSFFDMKNVFYAGNHGFEFKGRGLQLPARARKAEKTRALMRHLGRQLQAEFSEIPGAFIEDKNYTLSVHYRNVPRKYRLFFKRQLSFFRKKYAHWPFIWKTGKKVWEARPAVKWDKGETVLYLAKKFPKALPIVIGDDVTDEDMFKALRRRGITIRVGRSKKTSAGHYLKSTRDVRIFLEEIYRL